MLLVMVLCRSMTSRVALVMAPLLPGIRIGVGNMGLENGGGSKGPPLTPPPRFARSLRFVRIMFYEAFLEVT